MTTPPDPGSGFTPSDFTPSGSQPPDSQQQPPTFPGQTPYGQQPGAPGAPFPQQPVMGSPQYSPDGRYVWNGAQWVPVGAMAGGGGNGPWVGIAIGCGVLFLLAVVVVVISLTVVGKQVNNVFSNVYAPLDPNFFNNFNNVFVSPVTPGT